MFYTGVVENRQDPLMLGRCQIRVVGLHTHDKSQLKTEDLPWAYPMLPITAAGMSGVGQSPLGPVEGTWVVLMFRDHPDCQQPVFIGVLGGVAQERGTIDEDDGSLILRDPATGEDREASDPATREQPNESTVADLDGLRPARDFSSVSQNCINLIKEFEGLRLTAYQDSVGIWTIGYGNTRIDGRAVAPNETISQTKAESLLTETINNEFLPGVRSSVRTLVTQSMVDSLVCFSYNVGTGALRRSTLLSELNAQRYLDAASRFNDWTKAGGQVLQGLVRRRAAERRLFLQDGIPTITGDLQPTEQPIEPVDSDRSTGLADNGASSQYGFRDPRNRYPLYTNEPDTNRLARGEEIGRTIVFQKEAARIRDVPIAGSGKDADGNWIDTWDQSPIPYNAQYPYNHVRFTESGHVEEWDDTPRSERIHYYHKAGTYSEIDSNGTQVNRIVGDGYEILERNGYVQITGSQFVTIRGAQKVKVENSYHLDVDGTATINVFNNADINISGNANLSVKEDFNLRAQNVNLEAIDDFNIKSSGTLKMSSDGVMDIKTDSTLNVDYNRGNFGSGASPASGTTLGIPEDARAPELPSIPELTVLTRGASSAQVFETPEEGSPDAYRARQIERGNVPSDEYDLGTTSEEIAPPANQVQPQGASCDLIYNMETFSPSLVLSPHYTLGILTKDGTRPPVNQQGLTKQEIVCNLKGLCENVLEPIVEQYPNVVISSGFRRPGDVPNSSATSQHYLGQAADLVFPGFSRAEVYEIAQNLQQLVPHDQMLLEYSGSRTVWLHVSFKYTGNRSTIFTMRDHRRISDIGTFTLIA